ncbi:20519_t:CDS:2, partial [Gigaspora rosea]
RTLKEGLGDREKESPQAPEKEKEGWSDKYTSQTSNSSTPELSNIGYTILKKLGKRATKLLLDLLNTILNEKDMENWDDLSNPKNGEVGLAARKF